MKTGNRITLSRKELLKWTGELYDLKHKINLSSDLLDTPDFYWEREEWERFYLTTCRYFNIPRRTKVIQILFSKNSNTNISMCIYLYVRISKKGTVLNPLEMNSSENMTEKSDMENLIIYRMMN